MDRSFFAENTVTGVTYLAMLQNWLLPQMSEDSEDLIFQEDGAPPHWHREVRRFLNESLPQRWMGRDGKEDLALQFWAKVLLISHPETFLVGVRKRSSLCTISTNNFGRPKKNRITSAVNSVTQAFFLRVWNKISYRLDVTRTAGGGGGAPRTSINFILSVIKCNLHHICH
jgi:hypothetical protein